MAKGVMNKRVSLTGMGIGSRRPTFSPRLAASYSTWLRAARKEPVIFLVTVTPRYISGGVVATANLYLSTHTYNTLSTDSPANTPFLPRLTAASVPPFRQEIKEPFEGGVSLLPTGTLRIDNVDGSLNGWLPPSYIWEGAAITVKVTTDPDVIRLADAPVLYSGIVRGVKGRNEQAIEVEVTSRHEKLFNHRMPTTTFAGPNGEDHVLPIAYGQVKNIPLILEDATNRVYVVAQGPLQSIDAVYHKGVTLTVAVDYTVNLTTGRVTALANFAGQLTADVKGLKIDGAYTDRRGDFIKHALTSFGGLTTADLNTTSFSAFNLDVPGSSGIYVGSETTLQEFCQQLLFPVIGFLVETRQGQFKIGLLALPTGTPKLTATKDDLLGLGNLAVVRPILHRARMRYDCNWTIQTPGDLGDAGAVDSTTAAGRAKRAWLLDDWRTTVTELTGATEGVSLFPTAEEKVIYTYFVNQADADTFGQRWLAFFGVQRFTLEYEFPLRFFETDMHDEVRLTNDWLTSRDTRIIMQEEAYGRSQIVRRLFY